MTCRLYGSGYYKYNSYHKTIGEKLLPSNVRGVKSLWRENIGLIWQKAKCWLHAYLNHRLKFGGFHDDEVMMLLPQAVLNEGEDEKSTGQNVTVRNEVTGVYIVIYILQ